MDDKFGLVCDDIGAVEDIVPEDIQWASEIEHATGLLAIPVKA